MSDVTATNYDQHSEGTAEFSTAEPVVEAIIPLVEEKLQVGKRIVVTGTTRLEKRSVAHMESVQIPLESVSWIVERVAKNEPVDEIPALRHEGECIIYPVVEERVVVTRQLVLIEEVRVKRSITHHEKTIEVELLREELTVEHQPSNQNS